MNRRSFLSTLAAAYAYGTLPPRIFASGGIVNPDPCGFILESPPCQLFADVYPQGVRLGRAVISIRASDDDEWQEVSPLHPVSVFTLLMYGDGTNRQTGLIRT